ncbi:MAG: acyltransferase domain-containing protein [Acutalibacteraceae bacterium]
MEQLSEIINTAKKIKIPDELIEKINNINRNKILLLSEVCKTKSFDCLSCEDDVTRLTVILNLANAIKPEYEKKHIDESIFYDTMGDIRIWCENNGIEGLKNYNWLKNHVTFNLFKIGRLQYQFYTMNNPSINYDLLPVGVNEKVIYIHIPQGEKLAFEACRESLKEAESFFAETFPDYAFRYYFCESWLLFEKNIDFMKSDSNIIRFQSLFDCVYSVNDERQALERIFSAKTEKIDGYPENTSLQKAAKEYILNGNRLGMGVGVIKRKI